MMFRVFASILLFSIVLNLSASENQTKRPNVVIVFVDDFGWGDPSCYGNPIIKTPNIDRMAHEGIRFTQGYVASPICSPSRCGLLTGQSPARWRISSFLQTRAGNKACEMADYLDPKAPTLPRILKLAGYATAHIGKWHLGGGRDVTNAPKFSAYGYDLGLGTYESPEPAAPLGLKTTPWGPQDQLEPQQVPRHDRTRWMIDQTIAFMKENKKKPCFVNLWLDDTHTPFVPSSDQMDAVKVAGEPLNKTRYKAVMQSLDHEIGRLLKFTQGSNTLVLLIGDNGASPPFERERSGGLRGQKLSLYEGGIRVPFIVWWPGTIKEAKVNKQTVISTLDLVPSLAKICQAELPEGYRSDGEDLSDALLGGSPSRRRPLFWEYGRNTSSFVYPKVQYHRSPNLAIRFEDWKFLIQSDGIRAELYDLSQDREEKNNRIADHAEVEKRLKELLLTWRKNMP